MSVEILGFVGVFVAIAGVIAIIVVGLLYYKKIEKDVQSSKYKKMTQSALTNSDVSISEAVKYLRIVNSSKDMIEKDEDVQ